MKKDKPKGHKKSGVERDFKIKKVQVEKKGGKSWKRIVNDDEE